MQTMTATGKSKQPSIEVEDYDPYFGRREICLLSQSTVEHLFPLNNSSPSSSRCAPPISEWLSYVYYRTALPLPTIFHAFHLLRRLSTTFAFDPSIASPLVHHRLLLTALLLATKYSMDDSFSNKSWSVASKGLFTIAEINEMEFEMLESLNWRIGGKEEDGESLHETLEEYEREWDVWRTEFKVAEEALKKKRAQKEATAKSVKRERNYLRKNPYDRDSRKGSGLQISIRKELKSTWDSSSSEEEYSSPWNRTVGDLSD